MIKNITFKSIIIIDESIILANTSLLSIFKLLIHRKIKLIHALHELKYKIIRILN